ncbi:hypothetical protein [Hydrogenophaga sp. MI9]|uniref:hypothetical protein n=1 Tax=Hydrogenophaga sp. MI9 TaxID=3453719 RepID=UPI003EEB7E68
MFSRVLSNGLTGAALVLLAHFSSDPALAETTYACKTDRGVAYRSNSPCPWAQKTELRYFGPVAQPPVSNRPIQRVERAGEELKYLSPRCQTMKEGIRTAPNRGLSASTVQELRQNFERDCADENMQAINKARNDQYAQKSQQREASAEEQQREMLAKADQDRVRQQCSEMRLSIQNRKQRPNPTEGELKDLERFEQRFQERCSR